MYGEQCGGLAYRNDSILVAPGVLKCFWYLRGGRSFKTGCLIMDRALMQFFEKQPNMRNKASMFIWKESQRVEKPDHGSFLASTTSQEYCWSLIGLVYILALWKRLCTNFKPLSSHFSNNHVYFSVLGNGNTTTISRRETECLFNSWSSHWSIKENTASSLLISH